MVVVLSALIAVDMDTLLVDGEIGGIGVDPASAVVVVHAVAVLMRGDVGVSAEDAVDATGAGVEESAFGDTGLHAKPTGVDAIDETGESFAVAVKLLQSVEEALANAAEKFALAAEGVELVAMHGDVALAFVFPDVALVDRYADEVGHDLRKSLIVISFDPDDLYFALWVGELADAGEKFPMVAGETAEIEVAEDIAEKDETAKFPALEQFGGFTSAAYIAAEVEIGNDQSVRYLIGHSIISMTDGGYAAINRS